MTPAKILVILSIVLCVASAVGMVPLWVSVLTLALSLIVG
jgi:hypothetical protein